MARNLPAAVSTEIQKPVTEPNYLVELGFATVLRYATLRLTNWNAQTWTAAGATVDSVTAERAQLSLRNHDNSLSALVLNAQIHSIPCKIWQHYGSDAVLVFTGRLDSVPDVAHRVQLQAVSESRAVKYPDQRIGAPVFNHLAAAGTEIRIGSTTITLEDARG